MPDYGVVSHLAKTNIQAPPSVFGNLIHIYIAAMWSESERFTEFNYEIYFNFVNY